MPSRGYPCEGPFSRNLHRKMRDQIGVERKKKKGERRDERLTAILLAVSGGEKHLESIAFFLREGSGANTV